MMAALKSVLYAAAAAASVTGPLTISVLDFGPNRYELVAAGSAFHSRDSVEAQLLVEAANLAVQTGHRQFALLAMPGEQVTAAPHRAPPAYGARYANWHVEWYYKLPAQKWIVWRPQSGEPFWANAIDPKTVTGFEAHAIVEVGPGFTTESADVFDAQAVITDVKPFVAARP